MATRTAMRRTSTKRKTRRFPKRAAAKRAATKRTAPKRAAKRKAAPKRKVAAKSYSSQVTTPINNCLIALKSFINTRTKKHGPSDAVAKRLQRCATSTRGECRKKNVVNPQLSKCLNNIQKSLKGVPGVPKHVRGKLLKLRTQIRNTVRNDVIRFMEMYTRSFRLIQTNFSRLEAKLKRNLATARKGNIVYKVDPGLKRQIIGFEKKITTFKKKWDKRLNRVAQIGNPSIKAKVNQYKKQLEQLRKTVRSCASLIKKITGLKGKKTSRKLTLMTKSEWNKISKNWERNCKQLENFRLQVEQFCDQLKAIKAL